MRESVPPASLMIHTLPSPAAMPPSLSAIGTATCATTRLLAGSMRSMRPVPQHGAHTLPNPTARPEQGNCPTFTVALRRFVFGSMRAMLSLPALDIHTASVPMPTQSGEPGIFSLAMIGSLATRTDSIGMWAFPGCDA
jgi:hypothetical protein